MTLPVTLCYYVIPSHELYSVCCFVVRVLVKVYLCSVEVTYLISHCLADGGGRKLERNQMCMCIMLSPYVYMPLVYHAWFCFEGDINLNSYPNIPINLVTLMEDYIKMTKNIQHFPCS